MSINLLELVSASICLSIRSSFILQKVKNRNMNIVDKSEAGLNNLQAIDPSTIADRLSQRIIMQGLTSSFKNLSVKGEEDEKEVLQELTEEEVDVLAGIPSINEPVNLNFLDKFSVNKSFCQSVPAKDVVVWVDPLDGTKEYTLGICVNGKAIAGVMHHMETQITYWGILGLGSFKFGKNGEFVEITCANTKLGKICTTSSHLTDSLQKSLDNLPGKPKIIRLGGCGAKCIAVLEKQVDAYFYPSIGTKFWDTAAPNAIIEASGGVLTDGIGNMINYASDDVHNRSGLICAGSIENHKMYLPKNYNKL